MEKAEREFTDKWKSNQIWQKDHHQNRENTPANNPTREKQ